MDTDFHTSDSFNEWYNYIAVHPIQTSNGKDDASAWVDLTIKSSYVEWLKEYELGAE